jgi:hypothetical protein
MVGHKRQCHEVHGGTDNVRVVAGLDTFGRLTQDFRQNLRRVRVIRVSLVSSSELDDDTARAIAEVSQSPKGGLRIRFHDKRAALVELAKLTAQEKLPADQPTPIEGPRPTGADHLEGLAKRYALGLRVIEGAVPGKAR